VKLATFVALLYETVPLTAVPPAGVSVMLIVPDWTLSLNVAVGAAETATPVALDAGVCEVTAGCVPFVVVKLHVKAPLIGSPAVSFTPVIEAVYVVLFARAAPGLKVAVLVALL
jgi:hypothetical protein